MKKVFFMGAICLASSAIAQQIQTEKDSVNQQVIKLDEVLVSAVRAKETLPVTFSNISKKEIQQKNFGQQIPILLGGITNAVSYSEDGTGIGSTALFIRGNDLYRTNVTINGVPYNDSESQGVYWYNLSDFAGSAESIQVQRGVGTSTNGAGAFGASINVLTDAISENPYAEIGNFYGSYNTHKHSVKFSTGKIEEGFEMSGRFSKINSDGYIDRASSDLKSYFLQGAYAKGSTLVKALIFGGLQKTYLTYKGIDEKTLNENRRYNPAGEYYEASGNKLFYDNETDNYQQDHAQLHWAEKLNPYWSTNLTFHYTKGRGYWEQMDNWGTPEGNFVVQYKMDNDFYGTIFSANYKKNNIDLIFGGSTNRYDGDHFDQYVWTQHGTKAHHELLEPKVTGRKLESSSFAKLSWEFQPKWSLFADLQYRFVNFNSFLYGANLDESLHLLNPKAGITYSLNRSNNFYFSYARSTKEPNRSDYKNYAENITQGVILPKAESVNDFELGWRFISPKTKINANLYYMGYKDQLVLTGDISKTGYSLRKNSGNSYRAGLEVDAMIYLSEKFIWQPNFSLSQNKNLNYHSTDNTGKVINLGTTNISFSPNVVGGNTLTYSPVNDLKISWLAKYVSERYLTNENEENSKLEAYFVNNLNISYEIQPKKIFKSIVLGLDVNNILNKKYVAHGRYRKGKPLYYPQAERNFLAGITLNF